MSFPQSDAFARPGLNRKWVFGRVGFAVALLGLQGLLIVAVAFATGVVYHLSVYGDMGEVTNFAAIGCAMSLLFSLPLISREGYKFETFFEGRRTPARTFLLWNYAFVCLAVIGFLTKTTGMFSRGWMVAFYFTGLMGVIVLDGVIARVLAVALAQGRIARRRVMLVGADGDIQKMTIAFDAPNAGCRVVGVAVLPQELAEVAAGLGDAIDRARLLAVEDVVILTDWSRGDLIESVVDAFTVLPVSIHLGASGLIGQFSEARIARFGSASALSLTAPPLTALQSATKRCFDLVVACLAVVALAPVLVALAVAIKRDSPGPVFFRQRRRGYNLREFRIWKFRTMTTLDDGDVIEQAKAGDVRVTRVGAWLRRLNLDELPQLFNVIAGEMSIVGPRPHAVAHDRMFELRIAKYRRRLNVRPGITGWAQVHGLRGPTQTESAMRDRVEYDLYYIDNWSIMLDLYVIAATVLSPKAFKNVV